MQVFFKKIPYGRAHGSFRIVQSNRYAKPIISVKVINFLVLRPSMAERGGAMAKGDAAHMTAKRYYRKAIRHESKNGSGLQGGRRMKDGRKCSLAYAGM
jgi:hypothetical protein